MYEFHIIWTAEWRREDHRSERRTFAVAKRKPEKNKAWRDANPDLVNTGAAL